ncbi:MAG: hypothetical protein L0177_10310, partial [Chloroflexi bacterium]|nr:hypothetical protein [Chloroflexota bacterium]
WYRRPIVVTGLFGLVVLLGLGLGLGPGPFQELRDAMLRVISTPPPADSMRAKVDQSNEASSAPESAVEPPPKEGSRWSAASSQDAGIEAQSANLGAPRIKEQISLLLASADEAIKAGRLTSPMSESAADKYRAVLVLQPDHKQASQALRNIMNQLIGSAREALRRQDWGQVQSYLDEAARIELNSNAVAVLRDELNTRRAEAERQRLAEEMERERKEAAADQLVTSAREALEAKEWAKAEAHIEQVAAILPDSEEVKALQQALRTGKAQAEKKRKAQQAKQEEDKRTVDKLFELALKAMEQQDLQTAQLYLDRAAAIRPDSSDVALLRDELLNRKAQASRQTVETPALAQSPTQDLAGAEKGPTEVARLAIRQAVSSLTKGRPGETVEFYTEYSVTPPAGKKDAFVEATWVLMRNGKRLGEEGYQYKLVKPGVHTASTKLTLPPWAAPGRYTVEHRVQVG